MKGKFLFLLLLLARIGNAQPPSAEEVMKGACQQAARENKNVFVMFHASWCGWCHRMDNSMMDPAVSKFFTDNYVIIHLVVDESADKKKLENPGAAAMRTRYYGDGQGIPFWLVFDSKGNWLADCKMRQDGETMEQGTNSGCPAAEVELAHFVDVLRRTSSLNKDQLEVIRNRFRENNK